MNKIHLIVCGGNMALVINGTIAATLDPELHDNAATEIFDRFTETLPQIFSTELVRVDVDDRQDDWTWDDLLAENGIAPAPLDTQPEQFKVSWAIDVGDTQARSAKEAAQYALSCLSRPGSLAHYFTVTEKGGTVTDVDLNAEEPYGLAEALTEFTQHNDDDQDDPLFLYEVEVLLFDRDDPRTAIDARMVIRSAQSASDAKAEAVDFAQEHLSMFCSSEEFWEAGDAGQVDPSSFD